MGIEAAVTGALISGAATLAGGAMTNSANSEIASANNATAINLANTAHQREVKDLRAAGLNPILSADGGGASVPTMQAPALSNVLGDAMKEGITNFSALESSKQYNALVDKMRSEGALNNALALKASADTSSALSQKALYDALALKATADTSSSHSQKALYDAQLFNIRADTSLKNSGYAGRFLGATTAERATGLLNNVGSSIGYKLKDIISGITANSAAKVSGSHDTSTSKTSRGEWSRDAQGREHLFFPE